MGKLTPQEEKYLKEKLSLIDAVILGSLWGAYMFPPEGKDWGDQARKQRDSAMKIIEKDIRNIYKYAKNQKV